MKKWLVKVDILMNNGKVYYTEEHKIMAPDAEEAEKIVHNDKDLKREPSFRIASVKEMKDDEN